MSKGLEIQTFDLDKNPHGSMLIIHNLILTGEPDAKMRPQGRGNLLCFQEIVLDQIVIVRCVHRITTILMIVIRMMILVVPVMEMIRIQMLIPDCNEKRLCLFSFVHYLNCHNNV